MKKIVEIEDVLEDCAQQAVGAVEEELKSFLGDNPDKEEVPDLWDDLDYFGAIHEIVDGSVPVYAKEIEDIIYLHGDAVEESYRNAGIGKVGAEGWKGSAIYCYIQDKVAEWYKANAQGIFDCWKAQQEKDTKEADDGDEEDGE